MTDDVRGGGDVIRPVDRSAVVPATGPGSWSLPTGGVVLSEAWPVARHAARRAWPAGRRRE